jgi:hypothetical protein
MSDNPAMAIDDYVVDESWTRNELNNLLDGEAHPNSLLSAKSEKVLAEFACLIHSKSKDLSPEQKEQVIKWLKKWKLKDKPLRRNQNIQGSPDFEDALNKIRNSKEQKTLEKKAYVKTIWARLWAILFFIFAIILIGVFVSDTHIAWYWKTLCLIITLAFMVVSDLLQDEATKLYKEQEQRNLWEGIRSAETVAELREAGLFAYLPNSMYETGKPFNQELALETMRAEQKRLSDALYRDPSNYLEKFALEANLSNL